MVKCRFLLGVLCFWKRILREGLFFVVLNRSSINLSHNSNASPIDNYNQTHSRQLIKWQNTQIYFLISTHCCFQKYKDKFLWRAMLVSAIKSSNCFKNKSWTYANCSTKKMKIRKFQNCGAYWLLFKLVFAQKSSVGLQHFLIKIHFVLQTHKHQKRINAIETTIINQQS